MEKIFNLTSTFKALSDEDDGIHICGMASTADFDRAGDTIEASAWTKGGLNNFEKNPIILFNHDYNKPIGRATGLKVTENGLELKAKISKSAPDHVAQLVKEGILGAFSVGFRVKDAEHVLETDGLKIKDAELFEVSVVSVPCNQAATFSLAKSFDSIDEYNEFKKTFTNSVDLAGQSLAKDENSFEASDTPDGTEKSVQKEMTMSEVNTPEIDLDAFAKKVAEETAAKIAIRQAEEKAAAEAEAKAAEEAEVAKAAQEEEVKTQIRTGIESGADRLVADIEKEMSTAKESEINEIVKRYEAQVAEKSAELEAMRNSKRDFGSRDGSVDGRKALEARVLGAMTKKGWDTKLGRELVEKAGLDFGSQSTSGNLDIAVSQQFEEELKLETKVAGLFREIPVQSGATVMPFVGDVNDAAFVGQDYNIDTAGHRLDSVGGTDGQFDISNRVMNTQRLVAGTFIDNDVDEQSLVPFVPMITSALARAHAKATDKAILYGTSGNIAGIAGGNGSDKGTGFRSTAVNITAQQDGAPAFTASMLRQGREQLGKYGIDVGSLAYIVSLDVYYDLLNEDGDFTTVDKAGSDVAANINGMFGTLYGSPVIVSDVLAPAAAGTAAIVVNTSRFVIPRLRGVTIETEYQAARQRNVLVASQSLGFTALETTNGAASLIYAANA